MVLVLAIVFGYVFFMIERLVQEEAGLLLAAFSGEVEQELVRSPRDSDPDIERLVEDSSGLLRDFAPGVAVFRYDGTLVAAAGSLASRARLPEWPSKGPKSVLEILELGPGLPHMVLTRRGRERITQVALSSKPFEERVAQTRVVFLLGAPLAVLLAGASGSWLARRSLRPLARITTIARQLGAENLDERIPTSGTGDELDRLSDTLNEMLGRIAGSVEALDRFSAHAAHQLKTPLSRLRTRIEVDLEGDEVAAETRDVLEDLLTEVVALSETVEAMLRLARARAGLVPGQAREIHLEILIEDVVGLLEPVAEDKNVELTIDLASKGSRVRGDLSWLRELFSNIVENAIKFTPANGRISIASWRDSQRVVVDISDSGPGLESSELEKIFEPFYRVSGQSSSPGSGLGLPLAREIARSHGGEVEVTSEYGHGTAFRVRLPLIDFGTSPARLRSGSTS